MSIQPADLTEESQLLNEVAISVFSVPATSVLREAMGRFSLTGSANASDATWIDHPQEVATFLGRHSSGLVIVLLEDPVRKLAANLHAGQDVARGIETCLTEMRAVVQLLTTDRRRVLLVDHTEALRRPSDLAQSLRDHRGLDFPRLADLEPASPKSVSEGYYALALLSLTERPEARRLSNEIEASLLPLGASGKNRSSWDEATEDLFRLESLARRVLEQDALTAELEKLRVSYAALEADLAIVARTEATMSKRNLALMKEIVMLEAEREKIAAELANLQQHANAVEARARDFEGAVTELLHSTSWRLTAPVRALKNALVGLRRGRG
jgi:hypothetical protein